MNILIVEDHEESRYLQERILTAGGHVVQQAANGEEALAALGRGGVDLIISDILMPVMDGFQLCRKVKTDENLRSIPFIFYTATYTGPKDRKFAEKIGADRFIEKPSEPEAFMAAVNEVIVAGNRQDSPPAPDEAREEEVLRLYSERLVRKLEQKMSHLEKEIRARRVAEKSLLASERQYRLLADNTLDVIWTMTPELVFTYVNPAIHALTGYEPQEWIGTRLPEHCDRNNFAKIARIIADETAGGPDGSGVILETELFGKHGEPVPVEIHGRVIFDDAGEPLRLQGVARDTSERQASEMRQNELKSQLFQAQKMESVGRLAGGVAHDFNNKLSIILGYTEFALENVLPNEPLYADLVEVRKAAESSKNIVRQLLAFARQQTIAPEVIDLNDAVAGMLKMLRRLIGEDLDLAWLPAAEVWPVKIDLSQVDQILANLCVNARDAIADVGKLTIETGTISFDEEYCADHPDFVPGDYVLLAVSDDGCGIAPEYLDKVFEPFFTTKEIGRGTGLGLATVYGIVKQNNGFINIYSEPSQGTTFKVYLPRHEGKAAAAKAEDAVEIPMGHGETVLLVEDSQAIMELTRRMLEKLGYLVLEANTPGEAMRLADEHAGDIRLLITDVVMPEMNGRDLSNRLHVLYQDLRTLYMSGYTTDVIAHRGVLDEGVHFIQKPFSQKDLACKVREVLSQ